MKVIDDGHSYLLSSLDGDFSQGLHFVKRVGSHYPGNTSSRAGTTTQEVCRALLDRARYVNRQMPCLETEAIIQNLQQIILLSEIRAKRVKGKYLEEMTLHEMEHSEICETCGHISCKRNHQHDLRRI